MLKQGVALVLLHLAGIAVGLVCALTVAAQVPPAVFSLFGVRIAVELFVVCFTVTGFETHARRRFLHWLSMDQEDRIKTYVAYAFVARLTIFCFLLPGLFLYALYLDAFKYPGSGYLPFILLFLFSGLVRAWIDSARDVLQAFGRYLEAEGLGFLYNAVVPAVALVVYQHSGFKGFLLVLTVLPTLVLVLAVVRLWRWFSLDVLKRGLRPLLRRARGTRPFRLASYARYLGNRADQALVAVFCTPELMASFSLVKGLEAAVDQLVTNILDPVTIRCVAHRRDPDGRDAVLRQARRIVLVLAALFVICYAASVVLVPVGIRMVGLGQYQSLRIFVMAGLAVPGVRLLARIPQTCIGLFGSPRLVLNVQLAWAGLALGVLLVMALLNAEWLYWYRPLAFLVFGLAIRPLGRRVLQTRTTQLQ